MERFCDQAHSEIKHCHHRQGLYRPVALMTIVANTFEGVTLPLISNQQKDYLAVLLDILSKHLDSNSKNSARCLFVDFTCALNSISPTTFVNQLVACEDTSS